MKKLIVFVLSVCSTFSYFNAKILAEDIPIDEENVDIRNVKSTLPDSQYLIMGGKSMVFGC